MFELSVAFKYLVPRWRQLSVSIISLISILVISLVVWLIVTFFSVTHGLERGWVQKLIALTAPVRIAPTDAYYKSYYYLADSISSESNYTRKTIGEKLLSPSADPYNPDFDQEIPANWPLPDLDHEGSVKDLVKQAFQTIENIDGVAGLRPSEYEMTVANIKLKLVRRPSSPHAVFDEDANPQYIQQGSYLSSYDSGNPNLIKALLPVTKADVENLLAMAAVNDDFNFNEEGVLVADETAGFHERLRNLFEVLEINRLQPGTKGWKIALSDLPADCALEICALKVGNRLHSVIIPGGQEELDKLRAQSFPEKMSLHTGKLTQREGQAELNIANEDPLLIAEDTPLFVRQDLSAAAKLNREKLVNAKNSQDISFHIETKVQGIAISSEIALGESAIASFETKVSADSPFWLFHDSIPDTLPSDLKDGDAILLPKSFRNSGALIGDRGHISYQTATASGVQTQTIPIFVAGFYDPGILPLGGKIALINPYIVSLIRSSYGEDQSPLSNGINVRFTDIDDAEMVKALIEQGFREAGIDKYWTVQTFREFEFTKDILQQLRSERNLFTILAAVIIIVACSNIISMLIILVNDKKMEIGILRSMGATSRSIATIFGFCGIVMGVLGSLLGIVLALITLKNLQHLIDFISHVQGFEMFNPAFFGDTLPNQVSFDALVFVVIATSLTSLLAGIVPAVKASLVKPSAILRAE